MSNYSENHITKDPNHAWSKILKFIPSNSHILDIGCSSGNLGEFLAANKKCVVDGVEPDTKDATIAAKKLRKVWNTDIETAVNDIDDKYDVLIFADVLEHLLLPDKVLKMTKNLLRPNGRVLFSVPNMAHVSVRLAILGGDWQYTETGLLDKTHLHYWDVDTVKNVFSSAGMHLVKIEAVIYKYPETLIQDRLKSLGLNATDKGISLLTGSEASTFQTVGVAEPTAAKHANIELPDPALQKDISYMAREALAQLEDYKKHIKNTENHIMNLEKQIVDLEKQNVSLTEQLRDIVESRTYKAARRLAELKAKLKH
jgi:methionine biosynthesis protein MetW